MHPLTAQATHQVLLLRRISQVFTLIIQAHRLIPWVVVAMIKQPLPLALIHTLQIRLVIRHHQLHLVTVLILQVCLKEVHHNKTHQCFTNILNSGLVLHLMIQLQHIPQFSHQHLVDINQRLHSTHPFLKRHMGLRGSRNSQPLLLYDKIVLQQVHRSHQGDMR